ncbi:MAG: SH3 domain-containing protein, partial [Chloroflexota bacterium]|nr:SH3 domain-containing protein [Chloroflexota bacterium]
LLAVYMVPVGADILVIDGSLSDDLAARLQFARPAPAQLAVGQVAMTKPSRTWDLWSQATGGTRVYERPKLYGGTLLAILAIRPAAVWVRTSDGVTGWIRAPAATALTPTAEMVGEPARYAGARFVQVVYRTGVALRRSPRSTAPKLLGRLDRGQIIELLGVRGDWVRVVFDDGRIRTIGWARWHYNGVRFIDVVSQ